MYPEKNVAISFVSHYYTVLHASNPAQLTTLYSKDSVFSYGVGTTAEVHTGAQNIVAKILSLGYKDIQVTVKYIDCQRSLNDSVLVIVLGTMTRAEEEKKFLQTFFLIRQGQSYFVLNDVFRFLDTQEDSLQVETPSSSASNHSEPGAPEVKNGNMVLNKEEPAVESKEAPKVDALPLKEEKPEVPAASSPKHSQKERKSVPKSKGEPKAPTTRTPEKEEKVEAVASSVSAPPPETGKSIPIEEKTSDKARSWAQIVHPTASTPPPAPEQEETSKPSTKPVKEPKSQPKGHSQEKDGGIFVNNLPFGVSDEEVRSAFSGYGPILDLQLLSGKGFGFIQLESFETASRLIEASKTNPIVISGRSLVLDHRKPKSNKDRGTGSGKNGFRKEKPQNNGEDHADYKDKKSRGTGRKDKFEANGGSQGKAKSPKEK